MNDHELERLRMSTQILQNLQSGVVGLGRVAPPIATTSAPPLITTPSTDPLSLGVPRTQRRQVQYMPSMSTYGGAYNSYPYRGMTSMSMGGYNPYGSYGQPMNNQYQNPIVIAAAENSRPAFESIQSVVQSFNAVSMMLESTFTAMHMSFQALLGVAENFTRLRMFMMKLYSTIVSFKLARWFLTKLFYLLRMVRGGRESSTEEDLWAALSSTNNKEIVPSDGRSWPLVVFTGLLVATPYFVYKLLNSVTPVSTPNVNTPLPANNANMIVASAYCDWSNTDPKTIPLVKGQTYWTSVGSLSSAKETGWLLVNSYDGKKGYVPLNAFKPPKTDGALSKSKVQGGNIKCIPTPVLPNSIPEQVQPILKTPVTDVHGNPIPLPHPLVDCDISNINLQ